MRDDVGGQPAVEAAGQHHLDAARAQSPDCVLGARDRYTAAARQKPAQLALEHLKGRGRDLRCLVRRVAARREFGERG
jgi:hypothetical protein